MSINLTKGQKIDLTKGNAGLSKVMVGLGWDEAQSSGGGIFGSLFGGQTETIDCDAMAFLLDSSGKLQATKDVVFFNNLRHSSGSVVHQGDNLTGAGEGDDEQIMVDLSKVPAMYDKIVIAVTIYQATQKGQHFGLIRNAFIRLVNCNNNQELCKYNLSDNYNGMTALIFGELYRHNGEWKFNAVGQPLSVWAVADLGEQFGLSRNNWH